MTPTARFSALGLAALLLLSACSDELGAPENAAANAAAKPEVHADEHADDDEHGGGEHGDEHGEEETEAPRWDAAKLADAGIRIEALQRQSMSESLRAPGEVVDNAYGTTLITPRVEALVVKRHAKLGDDVAAGAPLVTLSSVEVAGAQATLRLAEQEWSRVQALGREAVSGRRYSEAQIAVEQARATAKAYGLSGQQRSAADGEFTLSAPHAGRLTQDNFVIGERIEPGHALFRLVDESVVWVDAKLPAEQAHRVEVGSMADVVLGDVRVKGKVVQRAHHTSETTRNAKVRLEVPNEGDRLHGGDFVEVYLQAGEAGAATLALPTAALVQLEGDTVAFRQDAEDRLTAVPVRTGAVIGDHTVILEGLNEGDRVVVEGAYVLKAQQLKAQLGEGHAH
ncbi:MAG: efflux RND transporter periplasmic adaptor subunit [Xanthomonadales bacterium]|jgi:cobalt-zinc-cadmium efflux system membrane fusion protein|nr:efflux RND transporter periplasmic adaptor subunit [Xanthomonadales bacterium]